MQSPLLFPEMEASAEPVHEWYQFVLGYEAKLVGDLLDTFGVKPSDGVFDPFCGTGTTLVECQKRGLTASGLDANPVATFVSAAKLRWGVSAKVLTQCGHDVVARAEERARAVAAEDDETVAERVRGMDGYAGFATFGLVERHWIGVRPLVKVLALREALARVKDEAVRSLLMTALLTTAVRDASNLKFGPEAYCALRRADAPVVEAFAARVRRMAADLLVVQQQTGGALTARVYAGDARDAAALRQCRPIGFVITSPPYPTEKDYTRNTRLELVLLESIADNDELRHVKKTMIRSHSKGIYKEDRDGERIARFARITAIVEELREKCASKTYGFAKVYPRVISEYFGGMHRHFESLAKVAKSGCRAAYVVGQQRTYLQTYTPTAELLAELAEDVGLVVDGIETYRIRRGSTGSRREILEEVLLLRKPGEVSR